MEVLSCFGNINSFLLCKYINDKYLICDFLAPIMEEGKRKAGFHDTGARAHSAGKSEGSVRRMTHTITEQDLIINLKAAGFNGTMIQEFLACRKAGKTMEQLRLLAQKREHLLDRVHQKEKQIQCLDYLVYQIEKEERH